MSTTHFSLDEFCRSDIAARRGIDNALPATLVPSALETLAMMERIRARLCALAGHDVPIVISSGYRSQPVNVAVGGRPGSDHQAAAAADWTAPAFGTPLQICQALAPEVGMLQVGQLIHEFGQWVHTSTRLPMRPINRIITISRSGVLPGIVAA